MNSKTARREFIRRSGIAFGAVAGGQFLVESLFGEILSAAFAGPAPVVGSSNYIHFALGGGPPRWMFDQLLAPNGVSTDNFVPGGFGTVLAASGSKYLPQYVVEPHVVNGKTIHLPPVWNMGLSNQDFSTILPNMLFVRGMNMEINSHMLSNGRQVTPLIGGMSLSGVVADASGCPVPALIDATSPAGSSFKSRKGLAGTPYNGTVTSMINPATSLLAPFKNYTGTRPVHAAGRLPAQAQVLAAFDAAAVTAGLSDSALAKMYDNAITMVDSNVYQMANGWSAVYAKYLAIVNEALHPAKGTLPGIFDKAIPSTTDLNFQTPGGLVDLADIRDMVIPTADAPGMAASFAITEMMIGRVTSSIVLTMPAFSNTQMTSTMKTTCYHDQHKTGNVVSTMLTTLFYRSFLGCMTELVASLKAQGIFNNTVIHVGGEFSRTPRVDGSGSDHGYTGSSTSIISGMIGNVATVGNIVKNPAGTTYVGTWGQSATYQLDGFVRPIQVNDVARTISMMLGVADIVTNGMPLLAPNSGGVWVPRKEEANNV